MSAQTFIESLSVAAWEKFKLQAPPGLLGVVPVRMRDGAAGGQQEPGEEDVPRRVSGQRRDWQFDRECGEHAEHGQTAGNNEQTDIGGVQFHITPGSRSSSESRSVRAQDGAINLKKREPVPFQLTT